MDFESPRKENDHEHHRARSSFGDPIVIQPKMKVGAADDPAEREADVIADDVVRRIRSSVGQTGAFAAPADGRIRRSATGGSHLDGFEAAPDVESRIQRARSSGAPLDPGTRERFETAMGTDLGDVRIHRSATADQLNAELSATAFTTGNDVFFSAGSYAPDRPDGQHLLAHELAHTVQQQGRVRRSVIRRFTLGNADFSKTTSVNVFQKGGSGNVAEVSDGVGSLIVKSDQLIGNEVVVANELHARSGAQSGGKDGYTVTAPGSRLATDQEIAALKAVAPQKLVSGQKPRSFVAGLDSDNPTVLMEKAGGRDFTDILGDDNHTKKSRFGGKLKLNEDSILSQMVNKPGPLTALGQAVVPDVIMGMKDRIIGMFNPDNFQYDESSGSFLFIDNTQNSASGFLTSVDIGDIYTHKESFDAWARLPEVRKLSGDMDALAEAMFTNFIGETGDTIGILGSGWAIKDPELMGLLGKAVAKNEGKMKGYILNGLTTGLATVMSQLKNPLPLVAGIPAGPQKGEAVESLLARYYVLRSLAPDAAWKAAGIQAQKLLNPRQKPQPTTPWRSAQVSPGVTRHQGGGGGQGGGQGGTWQSAKPSGKWQPAQPSGR